MNKKLNSNSPHHKLGSLECLSLSSRMWILFLEVILRGKEFRVVAEWLLVHWKSTMWTPKTEQLIDSRWREDPICLSLFRVWCEVTTSRTFYDQGNNNNNQSSYHLKYQALFLLATHDTIPKHILQTTPHERHFVKSLVERESSLRNT